jgi:hypothetical protein
MKNFAHWKNIGVNRGRGGLASHDISLQRDVITAQTGPGNGPIQFVVEIPDEATRDKVVTAYLPKFLQSGGSIDEKADGMGFEQEWPFEVRDSFRSGNGKRWEWSSL